MSINFNENPGFLLTRFNRGEGVPKADSLEKFGNAALGLLQLSGGRTINVTKVEGDESNVNNLSFKASKQHHLIARIAMVAAFIFALPVSLPLAIAGAIALRCSKSYGDLFPKKVNKDSNEIDLKAMGFENAYDAVNYLCAQKATSADLRAFTDLEDHDLKALAHGCPKLRKLKINSKNITELPDEFKNLEFLELNMCTEFKSLPNTLGKLKTLLLNCTSVEAWPKCLKNLETLHLLETPMNLLPNRLNKLKEFCGTNSNFGKEELRKKLPGKCRVIEGWPRDFNSEKGWAK